MKSMLWDAFTRREGGEEEGEVEVEVVLCCREWWRCSLSIAFLAVLGRPEQVSGLFS